MLLCKMRLGSLALAVFTSNLELTHLSWLIALLLLVLQVQ